MFLRPKPLVFSSPSLKGELSKQLRDNLLPRILGNSPN